MSDILNTVAGWFDGRKTYILCLLAIVVVIANHFWGPFAKLNLDPANWLNDIWSYLVIMTGRSAISKVGARGTDGSSK